MQPEDIDKLFRDQLREHAPAPPAYLWNQLEAELQPAKKRPAMWLYAAAAVVALLLVAGGGWLWQRPGTGTLEGTVATSSTSAPTAKDPRTTTEAPISEKSSVAQATPTIKAPSNPTEANRAEKMVAAATPEALATTQRPAAHRAAVVPGQPGETRAATGRQQVARATAVPRPRRSAAAEKQLLPETSQALATTAQPERPVVAEKVPAALPKPPAPAVATTTPAPTGTIEIEVRRGSAGQAVALATAADAPESVDEQQHRLVGRLLRKAGNAALREVREKVEVPVLTVNVLNHSLSTKDIQL
ncbi:hypothetical protein SAMN02745146_3300 [Hymenobacter daecheongensis DSM 21074]|uniref:Uncharacterized protein n=1 Tax=Hymenobacter daecheongensis DSM 21074 TaxID=1121955 RepID=A0A1M6JX47_9BACT|nr:hypothetical protein [Hymenobacter daecheongensis]SHJ51211.1 hypothetical protein SAMN02745146_3300 [Hymenobacter daecheongensis DSM 21074]